MDARKPHALEALQHVVATVAIQVARRSHVLLEGSLGGALHERRNRRHHVLMDFGHLRHDGSIGRDPTEPPSRHGVRFREAVAHDDAVAQLGISARETAIREIVVHQIGVHVVADHEHVSFAGETRHGLEARLVVNAARRVVRRREHDGFRTLARRGLQRGFVDLKRRLARIQGDERAAIKRHDRFVQTESRRGNDHLVAWIHDAGQGHEQGFGGATRHDHLVRAVRKAATSHMGRKGVSQMLLAVIGRVMRVVRLQRDAHFPFHLVGGIAVRFSERQQHAARRLLRFRRDTANARKLQGIERIIQFEGHAALLS